MSKTLTIEHLQLRHATSTEWTSQNPTLLAGELGIEYDTGKFKIGDGSTVWNALQYGVLEYTLPAAGVNTLGGVKIGSNITVTNGVISVSKQNVIDALGYTPATESGGTDGNGYFWKSIKTS